MVRSTGKWLTDQRQLPGQMDNEAGTGQPGRLLPTRIIELSAAEILSEIVAAYPTVDCLVRSLGLPVCDIYFRVSVNLANGDGFPDLSTLSIVHDHVSFARSYAKVV